MRIKLEIEFEIREEIAPRWVEKDLKKLQAAVEAIAKIEGNT